MYGWHIAIGIVYTVGCVSSLLALCKPPKKLGPLAIGMGLISFLIFLLGAIEVWANNEHAVNHIFAYLKTSRVCYAFSYPLYCLMWWFIMHLFGSLHHKTDHPHQKKGMFLSILMVLFILIFYTVNIVRVYNAGILEALYDWSPNLWATYSMWRCQFYLRWICGCLTMLSLCSLGHKFRRGQLPHVSEHCITKGKLMFCMLLKLCLMITYLIWQYKVFYPNAYGFYAGEYACLFFWRLFQVIWFSICVHIAATRDLPTNGTGVFAH